MAFASGIEVLAPVLISFTASSSKPNLALSHGVSRCGKVLRAAAMNPIEHLSQTALSQK
jgi:hypothetical protein